MNPDETQDMLKMYDERLARYGYSDLTLGWYKPKTRLRYHVLLDYWGLRSAPSAAVLDFGCGFGGLYEFAREQQLDIRYHGIDVNPNLIQVARTYHPQADLSVGDPIRDGLDRTYDIALASGAHNFALDDNWNYIERTFALFERHTTMGFAVNFLSSAADFFREENYHTDADRVLRLALRYSRRVLLRHDYMPFEFTVFVDKRTDFSEELTVFEEFRPWCGKPSQAGPPPKV